MFEQQPQNDGFAFAGISDGANSPLIRMLMAPDIVPGAEPGYELCKTIYSYHPLGAVLTDEPITLAQSQPREINIAVMGEERIIEQYQNTWDTLAKVGATVIIHDLLSRARTYGISSLGVGEVGKELDTPLDLDDLAEADLYFNVLDPLNTAGSLVLNQDPNSPDFLKPTGNIRVNGKLWHPSRLHVQMNERPVYIEFTGSSFGFVGRSIYQRALYCLKTYLQTLITDQMVTQKAGLLVAKMVTPGSFINAIMQSMFGWKRGAIKQGVTGQVLQIGITEEIETLNMQNLDKAAEFARNNVLKNIASAAGIPASIITKETLAEGFGEGSEDAKEKARYINWVREDMAPAYMFMDRIVQRKAWTPEFYKTLKKDYPELPPYETWLHETRLAFRASWPNYLIEPDSEKSKNADVQFKAVVALFEIMEGVLDPENRAELTEWVAANANAREELFSSRLNLDPDSLREYFTKNAEAQEAAAEAATKTGEEEKPRPFAAAS
jgi:Protein of unknown function (DUF1073)